MILSSSLVKRYVTCANDRSFVFCMSRMSASMPRVRRQLVSVQVGEYQGAYKVLHVKIYVVNSLPGFDEGIRE